MTAAGSTAAEHAAGGTAEACTESAPKAGAALAVRNLSVAYGNVVAVHDATFTVAEGDACAIIGPNGNGKSSILMGVTGMIAPPRRGRDLRRRRRQERRRALGRAGTA